MISFRYAVRNDISLIMEFTKKLAEHEGDVTAVKASEKMLEKWIFDKKKAEVLFLLYNNKEVGFCLFIESFASYLGCGTIFIDDLYVDKEYRGRGFGKNLLQKIAEIAKERECGRLEWLCFRNNLSSMEFYQHMNASLTDSCAVFRVTGKQIDELIELE